MILVGDIGGTHARFAIAPKGEAKIHSRIEVLHDDFKDFDAVFAHILTYYKDQDLYPHLCHLALAAPVNTKPIKLTNRPNCIINPVALSYLGDEILSGPLDIKIMNDFEALAYAVTGFKPDDVLQLTGPKPTSHGVFSVIGPGTGLGVGISYLNKNGATQVFPSEGGHTILAASTPHEMEIIKWLANNSNTWPVETELAVSGNGLSLIYKAILEVDGRKTSRSPSPAEITASVNSDLIAHQTVMQFSSWLMDAVGNLAVTLMPSGGIYIAGGVSNFIEPFFSNPDILARYTRVNGHENIINTIPLFRIKNPNAALLGAAIAT